VGGIEGGTIRRARIKKSILREREREISTAE
jgi:hypothetical protein